MTLAQAQIALNAILGSVSTLQHANGAGKIFELFVMAGFATRLANLGCDVWLQRSDGSTISPGDVDRRFIQRGGTPTGVPSAGAGRVNAGTIAFRKPGSGTEWEIWNGIQFRGRSGANHEIDVAVVPHAVGTILRSLPAGGRPFGRPRVAIECKDVGATGHLDETRAFVARLYDLTILSLHLQHYALDQASYALYARAPGPAHVFPMTYRNENLGTLNIVARRAGFASGTLPLTGFYGIEPHASVVASTPAATQLLDAISHWIVTHLP